MIITLKITKDSKKGQTVMYLSTDNYQVGKKIFFDKSNIINSILDAHGDLLVTYGSTKEKNELSLSLQNILNSTSMKIDTKTSEEILSSQEILCIKSSLRAVFGEVEAQVEKNYLTNCGKYKNIKKELYKYFFYSDYDNLIDDEIELLVRNNIDVTENIALIGAGSIPMTAILLHKRTKAKIICIDVDKKACELSAKLIQNLGLENKIIIKHSEACLFDYSNVKTVLIASLINNKKELLRALSNYPSIEAIVIRSAKKLAKLLYEEISYNMIKSLKYEIVDKTQENDNTLHLSMLINSKEPCGCSILNESIKENV